MGRASVPGLHEHAPMESDHRGFGQGAERHQQSPTFDLKGHSNYFIGTTERSLQSSLLARPFGLCETGKSVWDCGRINPGGCHYLYVGPTQDSSKDRFEIAVPPFLEQRDGARNTKPPENRPFGSSHLRIGCKDGAEEGLPPTLGKENWRPSICGCRPDVGATENDNLALIGGEPSRIRQLLQPYGKRRPPGWYSNLPSAYYPTSHGPRVDSVEMRRLSRLEKWDLHAPEVNATTFNFPPKIADLLKIDSPTNIEVRTRTLKLHDLRSQLDRATCSLSSGHLEILKKNGVISKLCEISDADTANIGFIGNLFLHPEPAKKRWRLIFHPALYNKVVRTMRLHSVDLPRLRHIIKGISTNVMTIKLDLKCAFFQVKVDRGLFCFRHKSTIFTLDRLPMGASTSVLIAQTLSLAVINEMNGHLRVLLQPKEPTVSNAFVDDIFISLATDKKDRRYIENAVHLAMEKTAEKMDVSFKTCQYGLKSLSHNEWANAPAMSKRDAIDNRVCQTIYKETLEVLGVDFDYRSQQMEIKDTFKEKAKKLLESSLDNISPLLLWKIVGTCIHVIYALGLDTTTLFPVFKILGKVARFLEGSDRDDPRWNAPLELSNQELRDLKGMIDNVSLFPKVSYQSSTPPECVVTTDASDEAAGAVIFILGRVTAICTKWNPHERSLNIIAKEAIAAWLGIANSICGANRHLTPLLAVDNTNVFFGLINGASSILCANTAIGYIRNHCQICLMWLPTESMPADSVSRLEIPTSSLEFTREIIKLMRGKWGHYLVVPRFSSFANV